MTSDKTKITYNLPDILKKLEKFCIWQERCEYEVRNKIKSLKMNMRDDEMDVCINYLKQNKFLDNNRFIKNYVLSKSRNNWGRIKIAYNLKGKGFQDKEISGALSLIDNNEYLLKAKMLIEKKMASVKHKNKFKIAFYMKSKGFEEEIVLNIISGTK